MAHVAVLGASGSEAKERVLTGADCHQLADAIVVAVTLALGASAPPAVEAAQQAGRTAELMVNENAVLQSIPALPNMLSLEALTVIGNPELQTLSVDLPAHTTGPDYVQGSVLTDPVKLFDIGRNAKLTRVSLTAGLTDGRFLAIYQNPALVSVDLGTLTRLEELSLDGNAQLASVELGALRTVESLSVTDNPNLDTIQLAAVRTFETLLTGNAKEE